MRLILKYHISDGCTYSCTEIVPIEYVSEEALLCDFDDALQFAIKNDMVDFKFAGYGFSPYHFISYNDLHDMITSLPEILTLDQWFASYQKL